jgi:hypothetical protein
VVSLVYQSVSVLLKEELNFGIFIPSNWQFDTTIVFYHFYFLKFHCLKEKLIFYIFVLCVHLVILKCTIWPGINNHIILATRKVEIRRIMVQGQPGQIVHKTPSTK